MRIVQHEPCIVFFSQFKEIIDRSQIAVHTENRIGKDQLAFRRAVRKHFFQLCHIAMRITAVVGTGKLDGIDQGCVVQTVGKDGIAPADIMGNEILPLILKRLAFTSLDDLYAAIGYGGVTATRTVNRIRDEILRNQKANQKNAIDRINEAAERRNKRPRHAVHGILVEGLDNCLIKFSRCCTPVPGDSIIGFITRGAGVSIHRTDCENYLASRDNPETAGRWIRVSWAERTTDAYSTTLMMLSAQRSGLVMDVATALNTLNAKVRTLTARDVDSGRSTITITVEVHDLAELRTIISRLSAIRGVIRISRSGASDPAKAAAHTAELQAEQEKKAKQEGKA